MTFPRELLSKYKEPKYIDEGGLAWYYISRRKSDDKLVIVKVFKTKELEKDILRGIENWKQLIHPNIARLYAFFSQPHPHLEIEYCEHTLSRRNFPLPVEEAIKIIWGISEGLKYAHSHGIIHKDIKPQSILLCGNIPKISNWEVSVREGENNQALTFTYAAPEQVNRDSGKIDKRTDIWQLGVVFYEMITGKLPFEFDGFLTGYVLHVLKDEPIPPSHVNPKAKLVEPIILKMLAKKKEERYQSVEEFQRDLAKVTGITTLRESRPILHKDGKTVVSTIKTLVSSIRKSKKTHRNDHSRDSLKRSIRVPSNQRYITSSWKEEPQESTASSIMIAASPTPEGFPRGLMKSYYEVEFLGEGGFARVYKAKRKTDGKVVALKIPRINQDTSSLFIREVAAWYNLNHKNIVRLYKADILPVPYLEMEFVEGVKVDGKTVRDLDAYPKPVDERTALKLVKGIAEGLRHAHSKGIYHLDLKPLNVLLKADLTPKITDWGLARISARGALDGVRGYSIGYAAPEQLDEETFGMSDHRTDIYQLGLIFYELLTGRPPYPGVTPYNIEMKILSKDTKPRPPSYFNSALAKYDGIFEKLLAKKKEDRYQSVDEFLSALESLGKLKREKEDLRKTTLAMKRSKSRAEFEGLKIKSIRQTVAIAILSAKLNDKALLLEALDDLRFHTRENFEDLINLIAQVEMLTREGIPISGSLAEKIEVLVRRIEGEALK